MVRLEVLEIQIRLLEKNNRIANEFIKSIAEMLNMDMDGVGFDGISLSLDDFENAIAKEIEIKAGKGTNCTCNEEDKHGETSIMCCNECGKPTEKFWRKGMY